MKFFFKGSQAITFSLFSFFYSNIANQIILKQLSFFGAFPLRQIVEAWSPDHYETCGNILGIFLKMH